MFEIKYGLTLQMFTSLDQLEIYLYEEYSHMAVVIRLIKRNREDTMIELTSDFCLCFDLRLPEVVKHGPTDQFGN